ncbi:MAG: hypothetical protein FK734_19400 [Asgard group archaeon]|nr:hypothetical protein [Asgard group archaeon]
MFEEPKMEKLTVNIPPVDIGRIDIMIEAGLYPSRTEFIRAAIRKTIDSHQDFIDRRIEQLQKDYEENVTADIKDKYTMKFFGMGVFKISKESFEKAIREGKKVYILAIGIVALDNRITPEMIEKTVEKVKVYGVLKASPKVKQALERISKNYEGD